MERSKIAAENKGVTLPNVAITIAHRADGSGTSNIFTTYLSKVSEEWSTKVGKVLLLTGQLALVAKVMMAWQV